MHFSRKTHISSKTANIFSAKTVKMLFFRRNIKNYILVILLTSSLGCRWKVKNENQTNIVAFRWFIWMHGRNEETNNTQMEHLDKTSRWTIWMHLPDVQTNRAFIFIVLTCKYFRSNYLILASKKPILSNLQVLTFMSSTWYNKYFLYQVPSSSPK